METFVTVLVLALAVGTISMTVTMAAVFRPLRVWLKSRSEFLGELFSCPYCLSHWLAFAAVLITGARFRASGVWVVDFFVTAFALVALNAAVAGLIFRAYAPMKMPDDEDE